MAVSDQSRNVAPKTVLTGLIDPCGHYGCPLKPTVASASANSKFSYFRGFRSLCARGQKLRLPQLKNFPERTSQWIVF